jgi:putative transposase
VIHANNWLAHATCPADHLNVIKRRPPRLSQIFQSIGDPLYFVTACALHRRKFCSLDLVHESLRRYGEIGVTHFNVGLGRYVIMLDHIHLFVRGDAEFQLTKWVKGLKRAIANALSKQDTSFRWQPGFFDHVLRNDESYAEKWNYVRENPVRAGLVKVPGDWPYQGRLCTSIEPSSRAAV